MMDYIVLGAGISGATISNHLKKKYSVLVIDKDRRPDSWSTVNFDLTQSFYSGGGSSRETSLKRQKQIKLKPSQINKIKKIIKNPEDKHYIENDNFRVSNILDALKKNK